MVRLYLFRDKCQVEKKCSHHKMQTFVINLELRPVSVTTTASVCKPLLRATWALLFWPTWSSEAVCKPTTFVVTEMGFRHSKDRPTISKWLRNKRLIIIMKLIFCKSKPGVNYAKICQKNQEWSQSILDVHAQRTTALSASKTLFIKCFIF